VLSAPNLYIYGEKTLSPLLTALSSSSINNIPLKSIQALKKNHQKLSKIDTLTPKQRRGLLRIFKHNKMVAEHAALSNEIISRITAARAPLHRNYTKRHVKPLSYTSILSVRDANQLIAKRKADNAARDTKRLAKLHKKVYGKPPPREPTQESVASIEARMAEQEAGELFYLDPNPMQ
jgi:hypothetical protein